MAKSWEKQNLWIESELNGKENEDVIAKVVGLEQNRKTIRAHLFDYLKQKPRLEAQRDKLYWHKNKILKEMGEKYVSIEDVEIEWYKWKKIRITLPEVKWIEWNEWFTRKTFEFFISNERVLKRKFESNPKLLEKSWSRKNVWDLLGGIREYMEARGVKWIDADIDNYENALTFGFSYAGRRTCEAGKYLRKIIEIKARKKMFKEKVFFLKDEYAKSEVMRFEKYVYNDRDLEGWRGERNYDNDDCFFSRNSLDTNTEWLFLRLSD